MSKQEVVQMFRELAAPDLRAVGFVGRQGHFLRRVGAVTQVVELQHSIYGGRVTANLGLGLEWLPPQIRWITPSSLGPHAHDCARWVRLGLVSAARADTWWSYSDEEESVQNAVQALSEVLLSSGLRWLETESSQDAFLRHAEVRLERSKSKRHPKGCFSELRVMAAVCAWNDDLRSARRYLDRASKLWDEEQARLQAARRVYRERHASPPENLAEVPDLLAELRAIISPTTDGSPFSAAQAARARRSKSAQPESSPEE